MNILRYRAWQFLHPDLDDAAVAGLQVSPRGGIALVAEGASVRQAILLLLSTSPGERVMRPDYGCRLRELVFAPNDDTTAGLAMHYVRQAIERWERRVEILQLDARRDPGEPGILEIFLKYRVTATQQSSQLTIPVDLNGG
jgi:uncharacterized protein